jgi:quercetin dioxygenase-like cupin family protein
MDSAEITGSEVLTFGVVQIEPGQANPEHLHPNCDEILYLLEGELLHTLGEEEIHLRAGDTIHIPQGVRHRARNPGTVPARMVVTYNTGRRQMVRVTATEGGEGSDGKSDPI